MGRTSSLRRADIDLDDTMLGKPSHLASPRSSLSSLLPTRSFRPSVPSYPGSASVGLDKTFFKMGVQEHWKHGLSGSIGGHERQMATSVLSPRPGKAGKAGS